MIKAHQITHEAFDSKLNFVDVLGVRVSVLNMKGAREIIKRLVFQRQKGYICTCPVSTIMACKKDDRIRNIVNDANLVTPDGMPLVWIGKLKGFKRMERVYGPDLMLSICEMAEIHQWTNYFYGSSELVLTQLKVKLRQQFPTLPICGTFSPPFGSISQAEDHRIIDRINQAEPDILWVGLGSPKQDLWMAEHRHLLEVPVMVGVGAAFDFLSGMKAQAPKWMQRRGLEWLFRLCCEPRRLWKRYLIGNTQFLYHLTREFVSQSGRPRLQKNVSSK